MMIAPVSAAQKPFTVKPLTTSDANKIIIAFITNVNRPSVKIFKGRVSIITIGFKNAFNKPITSAATNRAHPLSIIIPFTTHAATARAAVETAHFNMNPFIITSYRCKDYFNNKFIERQTPYFIHLTNSHDLARSTLDL